VKVLITGGGGMLACATIPALEKLGHDVLGLSKQDADVTQPKSLAYSIQRFEPDWIFHFAAFTKVDDCETQPDHAFLVNALGSRNAALAAAGCGASLLAISSDYVFPGDGKVPYREYDSAGPRSVYGASKWAGEQAVREVNPRHVIVRTSWLYGRGGPNFIDTILRKARAGEPLKVVNDQRGSPTYTEDLATALISLAQSAQYGTYHVTNSGDCTWFDLAGYALQRAGLRTALEPTDSAAFARPAPRPAYSVLANHFYEHVTGLRMPHWQDAVDRFIKTRAARERGAVEGAARES
jgi:dTDP-4-dehydrorhamnose reductase